MQFPNRRFAFDLRSNVAAKKQFTLLTLKHGHSECNLSSLSGINRWGAVLVLASLLACDRDTKKKASRETRENKEIHDKRKNRRHVRQNKANY